MRPTAIIGGGITGLALAYRLQQRGWPYVILEAGSRWGGKIRTERRSGLTIESGPEAFGTSQPQALALALELGLGDRLVAPAASASRVSVWDRGQLRQVPEGLMQLAPARLGAMVGTDLLTWRGKLRLGWEYFVPPSLTTADESLAGFVRRRLGQEVVDKIADPLLAGIHAADPEQLSLLAAFPRFRDMELRHGGLARAWMAQRKAAPRRAGRPALLAPETGMQEMVEALVARLPPERLQLGTAVRAIRPEGGAWRVEFDGEPGGSLSAGQVVCAAPAFAAAQMVGGMDGALAEELRAIRYRSITTVSLTYADSDVPEAVRGRGFMVGTGASRLVRACTWSSEKFPGRAPAGVVLLRLSLGNGTRVASGCDSGLLAMALSELHLMTGIAAAPLEAKVLRQPEAIPQLRVGHLDQVRRIECRLQAHPGLHLAGAGYHGAGVPQCVASADRALRALESEAER